MSNTKPQYLVDQTPAYAKKGMKRSGLVTSKLGHIRRDKRTMKRPRFIK